MGQPHFCYLCAASLAPCCAYARTQIRVDMPAHQVNSDLSNQDSKGLSNNAHIIYLRGCSQSQTRITVQGFNRCAELAASIGLSGRACDRIDDWVRLKNPTRAD